jgi:hypothetical protein
MALLITLHEAGHLVAGLTLGLEFRGLRVGPVYIRHEWGTFRAGWRWKSGASGITQMVPTNFSRIRRKLIWFVIGGPVATFASALAAWIWLLIGQRSENISGTASIFVCLSFFVLATNLLPIHLAGGHESDGLLLRRLLFDKRQTTQWLARSAILAKLRRGTRLRNINSRWIRAASDSDPKNARLGFGGAVIAYAWASDRELEQDTAIYLERCLAAMNLFPPEVADFIMSEAAIFQAWFRVDSQKASTWRGRIRNPLRFAPVMRLRLATFMAWASQDFEEAEKNWSAGLTLIQKLPPTPQFKALQESWNEWGQQMAKRKARLPAIP